MLGTVLAGKWIVKAMSCDVPCQILAWYQSQHASHVTGVPGPFSDCDIVGVINDFKISVSFVSKWIGQAWHWT